MVIITLAFALAFVSTGVESSCSFYDIEVCMTPFTDLPERMGISDKLAYSPIYQLNDEQLYEYCSAGRQVGSCLNGLYNCNSDEKSAFEGMRNAVEFLCTDTLEEYKIYQSCYWYKNVTYELNKCNEEATKKLVSINLLSSDPNAEVCDDIKDIYSCVRNAVEPECGKEAADWESEFLQKLFKPIAKRFKCNAFPKWAVWAIIVCGLLLVTIFIVIVRTAVVSMRNKRITEATAANQFDNVLAYPQAVDVYAPPPKYKDVVKVPA